MLYKKTSMMAMEIKRSIKRLKIIMTGLAVFTGIVFLLLSGILHYLETDHARESIQGMVNKRFPGTVSWKKIKMSVFDGRFSVTGFLLKAPDGKTLISLEYAQADLSWTALAAGDLTLESLEARRPGVWLSTDDKGGLNITSAFPAGEESKAETSSKELPFNIKIKSFSISGGHFHFEKAGERLSIEDIQVAGGSGNLSERSIRFMAGFGRGEVVLGGINTSIQRFRLTGKLDHGRLAAFSILLDSDMAKLRGKGSVDPVGPYPRLDLELDLETSLSKLGDALPMPRAWTDLKPMGLVRLNLKARGTGKNPEAALSMVYEKGRIAGNRLDRLDLACGLKNGVLDLDRLSFVSPMGKADIRGTMLLKKALPHGFLTEKPDLDSLAFKLWLKQSGSTFEKLTGGIIPLSGTLNTTLTLEGQGFSPGTLSVRVLMDASAEKVALNKVQMAHDLHLVARAALDNNRLRIREAHLESGDARMNLAGDYDLSTHQVSGTLTLGLPDLPALFTTNTMGVSGSLNGALSFKGSRLSPQADLALHGKSLALKENHLDFLDAAIRLSRGTLFLDRIRLGSGGSDLDISGTAKVLDRKTGRPVKDPELHLNVDGKRLLMEDFFSQGRGAVSVMGKIRGTARHPVGNFFLKGNDINLWGQPLHAIRLFLETTEDKVLIAPLKISLVPDEEILVKGWISPLEKAYELRVTSDRIALESIEALKKRNLGDSRLSLDLKGGGTFENPGVQGKILVTIPFAGQKPGQTFHLEMTLENHVANLWGKDLLDLAARCHLKTGQFSAKAAFDRIDLKPFLNIGEQRKLEGSLTGTLETEGSLYQPDRIRVGMEVSDFQVFSQGSELVRSETLRLSMENGRVLIPGIRLSLLRQGHLQLHGFLDLKGPLNLGADVRIPLSAIEAFTDEIAETEGDLALTATLAGTLDQPLVDVNLTLQEIGFILTELMQKVHGVSGRVHITPASVTLQDLGGKLDTGRFDLSGEITLNNMIPSNMDLILSAQALPVNIPDTLTAKLDSRLTLRGTPEESELKGEIVLLEGQYYKDVTLNLLMGAGRRKREEPVQKPESANPFLRNMGLNVTVKHKNPFEVENNIAFMTLVPDLRILGTLSRPTVSGRASVETGSITYQGKEFDIQKGVLDFLNPYRVEPTLDILSQVAVRKWNIGLSISGTPDNLVFKLTSDPWEEDGDIISLLAFGKTSRELIKGEGGASASTSQILAGFVAERLSENIKDSTGMDIFEMSYREGSERESSGGVDVTVGKRLSRRTTLKYGVKRKDGAYVQQVTTEYKFIENLLLSTFQDTGGNYGSELIYRLEFR